MTSTKESLETGNSVEELQSSQLNSPPKLESAHLRADAVSLEIPVNVHGSLVSNAAAGASPQAQPFEEQTSTMIVFPQGGVLRMSTPVTAGHVMVLTNLKSRQDAICRVVKVRAFAKAQSYVEIEFTSPQPGYWGVYFPSDGPDVRRVAPPPAAVSQAASPTNASPAPRVAAPPVERKAPEVLRPPAAPAIVEQPAAKPPEPTPRAESPAIVPPRPPAQPKLPQSSFASLGTQEDILAPADSTRSSRATSVSSNSLTPRSAPDADITDAIDALIVPSARASSSPVASYAAPREPSLPPPSLDAGSPMFPARPSLSDNGAMESRLPLPKQMFGVALDDATQSYGRSAQSLGSKMWLPIGIAALLAVGAAAAYHFYSQTFFGGAALSSTASAAPAPASQPVSQPAVSPSAQPSDAQAVTPAESAPASSASLDSASSSTWTEPNLSEKSNDLNSRPVRHTAAPDAGRTVQSSAPQRPNMAILSTSGAIRARPVTRAGGKPNSVGAAPALDSSNGPVAPVASFGAAAPPPPSLPTPPKPVSTAPVRVGGKIQPPRLVSSVLPVYPPIARQANVTGTIVVDTTIDTNGNVAKTRVISGPELLRPAALSALRQWKYEPSKLNGQPISVEMIISIQFH